VSYPVQKAAEAVYTEAGRTETRALVDYYLQNAAKIRRAMTDLEFECVGGKNSPYIWIDGKRDSWAFFDLLLNKAGVVCTPIPAEPLFRSGRDSAGAEKATFASAPSTAMKMSTKPWVGSRTPWPIKARYSVRT